MRFGNPLLDLCSLSGNPRENSIQETFEHGIPLKRIFSDPIRSNHLLDSRREAIRRLTRMQKTRSGGLIGKDDKDLKKIIENEFLSCSYSLISDSIFDANAIIFRSSIG